MDLMIRPSDMQKNAIFNEDPTPKPHDTSMSPVFHAKNPLQTGGVQEA